MKTIGKYGGSKESYDQYEVGLRDLLGLKVLDHNKYVEYGDQEWWSFETTRTTFKEDLEGVIEFSGIDLSEVLTIINKRIQKLLDKDHLIGHSYFINVDDLASLKHAIQNKILPLLQEYFYGDNGKIGLVLGKGFFEEIDSNANEDNIFPEFYDYDSSGFLGKQTYHLKDISTMDNTSFKDAIRTLLNK